MKQHISLSILTLYLIFQISFTTFSQDDTTSIDFIGITLLDVNDLIYSEDTNEIEIITASRTLKNLSDLPVTIHIITHDEIIERQYTSLTDILKTMPGMRVSQPGAGETGDYFEIRGLTGNFYTKILLNGVPVKPSVVKGMPLGAQLPVRQAERIEIIYGPASAIYGADAVSGVINIITKEADQGTFARADISLGQNEYNYFNFTIGGKAGKNNNILKYNFYGSKTEFNDLNIKYDVKRFYNPLNYFTDSIRVAGVLYNPSEINENTRGINTSQFINDNYGRYYEGTITEPAMEELPASSYMLGIDLNFRGLRVSYNNMYRRSHSSVGHNTCKYKYNNPQNFWGDQIELYALGFNKEWKRFSTSTQLSSLNYRMDNNSSLELTYLENNEKVYRYAASNDILFEQLFTFIPLEDLEIVSGFSYQKSGFLPLTNFLSSPFNNEDYSAFSTKVPFSDSIFSDPGYYPGLYTNLSGFAQAFVKKSKFRFMGGGRIDYNSDYGIRFSPRLAALYKINGTSSVRFSTGFAFKSPPPSLQYETVAYPVSNPVPGTYYDVIAADALKPERFFSAELGVATGFLWNIKTDLAIYYNKIYYQFYQTKVSTQGLANAVNDSTYSRKNENTFTRSYGIQASFKKENIIPSIRLNATLNLMFAYNTRELPGLETLLENVRFMPKHFGQLSVSFYPVKNLFICFDNVWESEWIRNILFIESIYKDLFNDATGFFTLDMMAGYNIGQNIKCFVRITNLFDEQYSNGLNATGQNQDVLYNPQLGRNIRIGLTYVLN